MATSLLGMGLFLWWLRKKNKNRKLQSEIDEIAKSELPATSQLSQTLDPQAVIPIAQEVGRRLEGTSPTTSEYIKLLKNKKFLGLQTFSKLKNAGSSFGE